MNPNCSICENPLYLDEYEGQSRAVFHCDVCDRSPKKNVLGGLLDKIKVEENYQAFLKRLEATYPDANDTVDEVTIQYHCIKCERPISRYGWCLECEDELRETL